MLKRFTATILTICIWTLFGVQPVAAQVLSHQQVKVDTSIAIQDFAYSVPQAIVIVPIFPPAGGGTLKDRDRFRGLFYYSIANERRSGFTDIPFHYVVSSTGEIFRGNSGGEERKVSISGVGADVVVIGYLAGKSDTAFDPRATAALGTLMLDVANRHSINLNQVTIAGVNYVKDDEEQTIKMEKHELSGLWATSLSGIVTAIKPMYSPIPKQYSVEIVKVDVPTAEAQPGQVVVGKITIKNTGQYGLYPDSMAEMLATRQEGASKFYIADGWASTSQVNLTAEDAVLLPGQEKTYEFKLNVPLYWGAQAENFELYTVGGLLIANSKFAVTVNIAKPSGIIVEAKKTISGFVRILGAPYAEAGEVTRLSPGERFWQIDKTTNGWLKVKLVDGREGWVGLQYVIYP